MMQKPQWVNTSPNKETNKWDKKQKPEQAEAVQI